jgi:hypothetical protein
MLLMLSLERDWFFLRTMVSFVFCLEGHVPRDKVLLFCELSIAILFKVAPRNKG